MIYDSCDLRLPSYFLIYVEAFRPSISAIVAHVRIVQGNLSVDHNIDHNMYGSLIDNTI